MNNNNLSIINSEDIELMWCAGADNIYFKNKNQLSGEDEFKKLPNPYLDFFRGVHPAKLTHLPGGLDFQ